MGDANPEIKNQSSTNPQNKKNPSKFYSHFLFKALILTIFLAIIPLFHSDSPDFSAPQWELLYLIFVGIAVSYGLFSRRRNQDDLEGENNSKSENSHSYMSRLLQFPSVFDDEIETPSGFDENNGNKYQTWSSRYHRNEPMVVLAKRGSVSVEKSKVPDEKPLLLPVRSLKSRVSDENGVSRVFSRSNSLPTSDSDEDYESSRVSNRLDSSLSSKGSSNDSRRSSVSSEFVYVDEDYESSRVSNRSNSSLISIDSRRISRQGSVNSRITVNEDYETSRVTNRSNSSVSSRNSKHESLNESNGVSGSTRTLSNSSSRGFSGNSSKDLSRKYEDSDDEREEEQDGKVSQSVILSSPIPWQSRSKRIEPKSDRLNDPITFSPLPPIVGIEHSPSFNSQSPRSSPSNASFSSTTKISSGSLAKNVEDLGRRNIGYSSRLPPPTPTPPPPPPPPPPRSMSAWSEPKRVSRENITTSHNTSKEIVDEEEEEARNGVVSSVRSIRSHETMSKEPFSEFPKETRDFLEGLLLETDDDSESEDNEDNYLKSKHIEKTEKLEEESPSDIVTDEGPDVDKKADEFIAKFREQIRLQRIASIKRSTGELKRSSIS